MTRTGDDRIAREIAKHLNRRRRRGKLVRWAVVLGVLAAAALYLRFGLGLGPGLGLGRGTGEAGGAGSAHTLVAPRRCAIRVTVSGIIVDGKPMQRDEAVAACKPKAGTDVIVTGNARQGDGKDLLEALRAAEVKDIVVLDPSQGGPGSN